MPVWHAAAVWAFWLHSTLQALPGLLRHIPAMLASDDVIGAFRQLEAVDQGLEDEEQALAGGCWTRRMRTLLGGPRVRSP